MTAQVLRVGSKRRVVYDLALSFVNQINRPVTIADKHQLINQAMHQCNISYFVAESYVHDALSRIKVDCPLIN